MNNILDKLKEIQGIAWGIVAIAFIIGLWIGLPGESDDGHKQSSVTEEVEAWTCSMHPSVNLPEPGQCPICFMDLIPVAKGSSSVNMNELSLSYEAQALAGVETMTVKHGKAFAEINVSGKVDYDETRIKSITAWVPGRIERLFVDFTGISVQKGDHLVELYSPELYSAQEEFLQAIRLPFSSSPGSGFDMILAASRQKLQLLGLTNEQIAEIEDRGAPSDRVTIFSPISGVVIAKSAVEGNYVKTGSKLFDVVGLDKVWVKLDVYETEVAMIQYGQNVTFTTAALPGHEFSGAVAFIDPIVDEKTRTVRVRLNVDNASGMLKPGMFTNGTLKANIDSHGQALGMDLTGKWVCPMHPEEVHEQQGVCSICGMKLESAESLGFVHHDNGSNPLLIPASAVLKTGQRAIVYVQKDDETFEGREIVLGHRAGDYYVVRSGLQEGERVVVRGNFKIDSAMQIAAKPSMMNPDAKMDDKKPMLHQH